MIETIIFLLGVSCVMQADYIPLFPDAYVVCSEEQNWHFAKIRYAGFEEYYNVIYVTQDQQHEELGQAWFREGMRYAYAVNNFEVIKHEKAHLDCLCHFTLDKRHDHEREQYEWLWKIERGKEDELSET